MTALKEKIKVVAFDADDTLWVNEPYFKEAEEDFCDLMEDFLPRHSVSRELLAMEIKNLAPYGYGIKAFTLSMIEAAIEISEGTISSNSILKIIQIGKNMLDKPVVLIDGVDSVLQQLKGKYRLVMATKGDLLDQEKKLWKSGLADYFHHTEIVSEKKESEYQRIIKHLDIDPSEFLMIGNSLKSDILPVLNIGGHAYHVPFHVTWELERVDKNIEHNNFRQLKTITDVLQYIS